jgi:hypothetical protein
MKYTQLDFRIETDNIRCFISLSGLRKVYVAGTGFQDMDLSKFDDEFVVKLSERI